VLDALYKAGFRGQNLIDMAAIPARETGGSYDTTSMNPNVKGTGDWSWGLWQINLLPKANLPLFDKLFPGQSTNDQGLRDGSILFDPYKAAYMAFQMSGGTNLSPWGGYKGKSNTYNVPQSAIDAAKSTAEQLWPGGYGDVGAMGAMGGNGGYNSLSVAPIHAPISIVVNAQGSQNIDMDRLASIIAGKVQAKLIQTATMARR